MNNNNECREESGIGLFCWTSVYDWSIKLALLPQPIRCKIKTKNVWWPAFSRALTISVTFILSFHLKGVFNFWPLRLLLFWFYDTQTKSALLRCDYILLNTFLVSCLQTLGNQHQEADLSAKKKFWLLNRLTCTASGNKTSNIFNRMGTWLNTRPKCRWVGHSMSLYLFLYS